MKVTTNADALARRIQQYKKRVSSSAKAFLDALADEGISTANPIIAEARQEVSGLSLSPVAGASMMPDYLWADDAIKTAVKVVRQGHYRVFVKYSGEDAMFIEFSAGVNYGTSTFPTPSSGSNYGNGYGVGTYPGQIHAFEPNGWIYEKNGQIYQSVGNKAFMPLYHAGESMVLRISDVARRTFS